MKGKFGQMGLGGKLAAITFLLVALIFGAFAAGIGYSTSSLIERRALDELTAKTKAVVDMVEVFNADLKRETLRSSKILEGYFPGQFILDTASRVNVNGVMTPTLKNGGSTINLDHSIPDRFSSRSGVMATILVKTGEEFVRISTSMKDDKGERAVGTRLDHAHPAYRSLLAGTPHSGIATIFGREFFTQYQPIKDGAGQVIAALFVGIDFTEDAKSIKNNIRQIKVGQSGYFYILDSTPGAEYGNLVLHPESEGANILGSKDAKGHEFIREILEKKQGTIVYPWKNPGESSARDKIVSFASVPSFEWVIGGGAYLEEVTGEAVRIRNISLIAALIAVGVLSFLLLIVIRRMVVRPLAEATHLAQQLARGDLTVRVETRRTDEIGSLVKAVNSIARGLANVVWNVRNGTETIATAAGEVASGNQDLSSRTEQQASSLEETASSMEELTSTVRQNADSAHHANDMATEASDVAVKGGAAMNEAVETMVEIHAASKKIADIITVIDGIAFQTNILALNAAVEAARAGEQGRGFAVVATEVRNLAQRSAAAAREIKELIEDSVRKIEEGSKMVHGAGDTMAEVVGAIRRVQGVMSEIAAATREQSDGIEQVNQAITQMDTVTQQNAALVEQAAAATEAMQNQTQELVRLIGFFRLNASKFGTAEEAIAMVKMGVESLKGNGRDVMFAEVNDKFGPYTDRDLYVVVYDMNGRCLAHGANPALIGKDLIDAKDGAGALYVKERVALVGNQENAWQNYAFMNPVSRQVESKAMYLERVGELIVGCGVYR